MKIRVGLVGNGWGFYAALDSLREVFQLEVVTEEEIIYSEFVIKCCSIEELKSEIVICAGFKPLIPKSFLNGREVFNIHYSLLPQYRGLHSTAWAILNEEKELGLTIHKVNEFIDDGPILVQHSIKNDFKSSLTWYMEYFNNWVRSNLSNTIIGYLNGELHPTAQESEKASWCGRRRMVDNQIDFHRSHTYNFNLFRILSPPYPSPYFKLRLRQTKYFVGNIEFRSSNVSTHNGRLLNIEGNRLFFGSQDGFLILSEIFLENGSKVMVNKEFKIGQFVEYEQR